MNKLKLLLPFITIISLFILWQILTTIFNTPSYIFPKPTDIGKVFIHFPKTLFADSSVTLYETLIGILIAIVLGIFFASLLDLSKLIKNAIYPILVISQTVPVIVLAPLFIIYFGFGLTPKIITITLMCFFPIAISLLNGLTTVDQRLINLAKSYGAKTMAIYIYVKFPASLPSFFAGLKVAITYSVTGAVVGEWIASSEGLGHYMLMAKNSYNLSGLYAAVILVIVLSLLLTGLVKLLERKICKSKYY